MVHVESKFTASLPTRVPFRTGNKQADVEILSKEEQGDHNVANAADAMLL